MSGYNQQNGAIFDAPAIEARINALDGKGTYNQQNGASLEMAALAYRLALLDGKIAKFQGGTQFDVADLVTRLNALEAGIFTPLQLFAAGEQGGWYDPSDFSTMFQDSAGTTPVTASGQPVGKILDKSGNGNHLIQGTTANRPVLTQDGSGYWYLAFNGTNSAMSSAAVVNYSAVKQISVFAGVTKSADQSGSMIVEHGPAASSGAGFGVDLNGYAANGTWLGGAINFGVQDAAAGSAVSPVSAIFSMLGDATAGALTACMLFRKNSVQLGYQSGSGTVSNVALGSQTTYIGARAGASLFLSGRIYQLILRGATTAGSTLTGAERYVGTKMGIAL